VQLVVVALVATIVSSRTEAWHVSLRASGGCSYVAAIGAAPVVADSTFPLKVIELDEGASVAVAKPTLLDEVEYLRFVACWFFVGGLEI
jgi:hypothetical protein